MVHPAAARQSHQDRPPTTLEPTPAHPDEAWSVRRTTWEADQVLHPEIHSAIALTIEAPGQYANPDGVSLHLFLAGGPHGRRDSDQCRVDLYWWELDGLASGLLALIERARRDGTIPTRSAEFSVAAAAVTAAPTDAARRGSPERAPLEEEDAGIDEDDEEEDSADEDVDDDDTP